MGAAREVTLEGGGGADSIGNFLPRVSAGGTIIWSVDMGAYGDNYTAVRGCANEFTTAGHT